MLLQFQSVIRTFWLIALLAVPAQLLAGELQGVRLSAGPNATRVVLDLDRAVQHRIFELADPTRVVIDLSGTTPVTPLRIPLPRGDVSRVRTGARADGELRIVLDLKQQVEPKSFMLPPEGRFGHRLVIDLAPSQAAKLATRAPAPSRGRDIVVAIDAGHGGKDPGASGPKGAREKDVVLAIAQRLARRVDQQPGFRARLIRDGDYFVSLKDRIRIAREAEADLFVSVHADAFRDSSARGATVYALSTRRATDEVARRLAERENASDLIGGVSIADKDDVLARVLLDLSQNASISASMVAGERVIDQLGQVTRMRKTSMQQGSFLVLTSPDIPSIFVETAYISNPRDESSLRDPDYQDSLAAALHSGIVNYFRTNGPPDSYIAHNPPPRQQGPIRHVIARGETLSEIAERYRVSLRSLRSTNSLNGDVIRIGQVLTIPTTS
jgi:N-acetylmuramoyl-L-alanine amidase